MGTAGGVLFAASRDGNLFALDAQTGSSLWRYHTGANMRASPMALHKKYIAGAHRAPLQLRTPSCRGGHDRPGFFVQSPSPMSFAVDDTQYVAIASGDTIYCFALSK